MATKKNTTSKSSSAGRTLNSKGYDPSVDYSLAIVKATSEAEREQLRRERENKINDKYGGSDPYQGRNTSLVKGTGSGTSSSGKSTGSSSSSRNTSSSSATRPSSGGSSYGTPSSGSSYSSGSGSNYHQNAIDAAARGDWDAVTRALADRQAKIDQQGGNDRGTSNAQILAQLQAQYPGSYGALSGGMRDKVDLNAGYSIPYGTYAGDTGQVYKDRGWQQGTDYLAQAQRLARAGDLEGAYDALMRRGFKMADTGSTGGGTTQDQAYAQIHQLYNQSGTARQQYLNQVDANRRLVREHQTQFGLEIRPELANRRFLSTDGRYVIYYDDTGTPAVAKPNSSKAGKNSYIKRSPEEIALMNRLYNGGEDTDFAGLQRQLHNINVVRTGVGRLIDQQGNYASGTPIQPVAANDWTGLPQTDRYQDKAALRAILEQINAGTAFPGGSTVVPTDERAAYLASIPAGRTPSGGGNYGGGSSGWSGGGASSGWYGGSGGDLSAYLRQVYEGNLAAQLAALRAAYEQNTADYRAHDDLITQAYQAQRNQAAAQNDLQRMYLAETGVMQGLNTGAYGQLALAQSAGYQGSLAELLAAESQDRAANDLALRNLAAAYQGDVASAQAQNSAQLAEALYGEYTRQIQAAEAARKAALAQENWERQFAYQQEQDALDRALQQAQWEYRLQADRQEAAYSMAANMLKSGVLPDGATLAAAGISPADAQAYAAAVDQQKTAKSSGGSGRAKSGSTGTSRGNTGTTDGPGMNSSYFTQVGRTISAMLAQGKGNSAVSALDGVWEQLSNDQRNQIQALFNRYGYTYQA